MKKQKYNVSEKCNFSCFFYILFVVFITCSCRTALATTTTVYTVNVTLSPCDITVPGGSILNMPKVPKTAFENVTETHYSGDITLLLSCPGGTSGKLPYITISGEKACSAASSDDNLFCAADAAGNASGIGFILREGVNGSGIIIPSNAPGAPGYKLQIPGTTDATNLDGKIINFQARYARGTGVNYSTVTAGQVSAALNFTFSYE
ncbi:fimbrial protein [Enterobacter asburiae]|nr:fimbrial protein [Enterobacter asburiae]